MHALWITKHLFALKLYVEKKKKNNYKLGVKQQQNFFFPTDD